MQAESTAAIPDDFGHWLAGFIDGEGCFQILELGGRRRFNATYQCTFSVTLRRDDLDILREIQQVTGLGKIRFVQPTNGKPAARLELHTKPECVGLVRILDRFPLRAKKREDYQIWRKAVVLWGCVPNGGAHNRGSFNWQPMIELRNALRMSHRFRPKESVEVPQPIRTQLEIVWSDEAI